VLQRVLYIVCVLLLATIGALIASRQPRNLIGWLCCAWAALFAAEVLTSEYATSTAFSSPGALPPGAMWFAASPTTTKRGVSSTTLRAARWNDA
jgi:hypothetical protein